MRSDVKHLAKCGKESLYYCQMHREFCPKIWDTCAYKPKKTFASRNKICRDHDHTIVIYDERVYVKGCPLCELEKENTDLRIKINAFTFKLGAPVR